ncbi:Maf family protein [Meiothermus cerbereus]|uniref:Maf family protein n=1 Tax=Meiothermus cerbereus TaxID=65552 RepID=UPI00048823B0|nr:nucleoside triphosphate pyrophosphatase [Meiothermus cerbereus]
MKNLPTLILASQSPRRAELLKRLALPFEARPADIDEEALRHLEPAQMAQELAAQKARVIWQPGLWVLAADTVVALEGETLGKPKDLEENKAFLRRLSGRTHTVYTGFAILKPDGFLHREVALAQVTFRPLRSWELEWYAQSGEGLDKAGGYGAQGLGMVLLERIEGDFYTVMGLPVSRVWQHLYELGYFGLEPDEKR